MSDLLFQPGPDSDPDADLLLLASRSSSNERTTSPRREEVPGRSRTALAAGSRREDSRPLSLTAPPSGPDDVDSGSASGDLLPDDVYRIANGREVRDTPWTRLVDRTRSALAGPRAKQEEQLDHALEELRVRGLARGVTVALGSIKGGAGKTTIALSLAEVLADALRVGVLVIDADLELGTASDSAPRAARRGGTISDVYREREHVHSLGQLAPFLINLPSGAHLLASPTDPDEIERIDGRMMGELLALLRRLYPVILVDLPPGMGLRGSVPGWGFAEADEIVVVATPKRANIRQVGHMLAYVAECHRDVPVTLALNMVPARPDQATRRIIRAGEQHGRSHRYGAIPQDRVLERQLDAGVLDLASLDQRTRIAIKELTYHLASGWCR